jgi:hypothetical protein
MLRLGIEMVEAGVSPLRENGRECEPSLEGRVFADQGHDGFVYGSDLAFDLLEPACVVPPQERMEKVPGPVLRGKSLGSYFDSLMTEL